MGDRTGVPAGRLGKGFSLGPAGPGPLAGALAHSWLAYPEPLGVSVASWLLNPRSAT